MLQTQTTPQLEVSRAFMNRVFSWMFAGLATTAAVSFITQNTPSILMFVLENFRVMIFAQLGFVLLLSFLASRISGAVTGVLFMVYATSNGLVLTPILLAFTESSVLTAFVSASAMFGAMALIGYTTKMDLTKFGSIMLMGLIGLVVAGIANLFLNSGPLGFVISLVGVVVFCGLTAYDMQKLKNIALYGPNRQGWGLETLRSDAAERYAVMGAFELYLDFINLFLKLLQLFGRRR
jgi:uncharacterized protein